MPDATWNIDAAVSDGSAGCGLDPTFANGGLLRLDDAGVATALVYQTDGKIVVAGGSVARLVLVRLGMPAPSQAVLYRLKENGAVDTALGSGGVVRFSNAELAGQHVPPSRIALQGCNLTVAGLLTSTFAVARVNTCCVQ